MSYSISPAIAAEPVAAPQRDLFYCLFEMTPVGIALAEPSGRLISSNPALLRMLGYTASELQQLNIDAIIQRDDASRLKEFCRELIAGDSRQCQLELRCRHRDGSSHPALLRINLVTEHDDARPALLIILEDLTSRKEAEEEIEILNTNLAARAAELESANRELEAFSYTVSHDLRSPLTNISGYSQLLLAKCANKCDEKSSTYLNSIYSETRRMDQLISTLLNFARLTGSELSRSAINLSDMAQAILLDLQLREPDRQVDIGIEEGVTATGDAKLVKVALQNLLANAWKFTAKTPAARITFGSTARDGRELFFVRDNGVGFSNTEAGELFRTFRRLTNADDFEGYGIGLATVRRIVMLHGGKIWAEGKPGKGATFYFTLSS